VNNPDEPIGTVSDELNEGTTTPQHRTLRLVGLALLCAVIGLGTWQLVVLHNQVSSLQSQNHSQQGQARIQSELDGLQSLVEQAPTGGQYDSLLTDVRALQSQVNGLVGVGTSGLYANASDLLNLRSTVSDLQSTVTSLESTVSYLTNDVTKPQFC
jgi:hypothetical protein